MQRYAILLLAAGLSTRPGTSDLTASLEIRAQPPSFAIVSQPEARHQVNPPRLAFPIEVDAECPAGGGVQSVTISIADTRETIRPPEAGSATTVAASLEVIDRQLAPIVIEGFCAKRSKDIGSSLFVASLASVHVSLRCHSPEGDSIHYGSHPVGVELVCTSDGGVEPAARFVRGLPW